MHPRWAAFSPDGQKLFTADKTVKLWDLAARVVVREFPGMSGALSPDGHILYTCTGLRFVWEGSAGVVTAWNVDDGSEIFALSEKARCIALSRDGAKLAVSDAEIQIAVYDARDGRKLIGSWSSQDRLWDLEFSPDASLLVASGWSSNVRVWDLREAVPPCRSINHPAVTWQTSFSMTGDLLAVGCSDRQIHFWDTRTWKEMRILHGHDNEVWSLAWQPNGLLLSSGRDPHLLRWRTAADPTTNWLRHDENSFSVAWLSEARIASIHYLPNGSRATSVSSVRGVERDKNFLGETPLGFDPRSLRLWLWTDSHAFRVRGPTVSSVVNDIPWESESGESMMEEPTISFAAGLAWAAL